MDKLRKLVVPALASVLVFGCGSSGKSTGAGGAGGGAGGSSGSGTFNPINLTCSIPGVPSTAACTDAELAPLQSCFFTNCGTPLQACYGPAYMSGQFAGTCAAWAACTNDCACTDTACRTACGTIPTACATCLGSTLAACGLPCLGSVPACAGGTGAGGASGGGGGAGGALTCVPQVLACCARATGTAATECAAEYQNLLGMGADIAETACGVKLASLKAMYCP